MAKELKQEEIESLLLSSINDSDTQLDDYKSDNSDEIFEKEFYKIFKRVMLLSGKAHVEGLLSLEDYYDREKAVNKYILDYGLSFVIDGTDESIVDKILTNIINQEKDEVQKKLKIIMKEAVMAIQCNMNSRLLAHLLNSYTNIPLNAPEYNKIIERSINEKNSLLNIVRNFDSFIILIYSLINAKLNIICSNKVMSKTWLVLTIAKYLAIYIKKNILFISLEISKDSLCKQISRIYLKDTFSSDFSPNPPFDVIDNPKVTFSEIKQFIIDLHNKKKIETVFIDSISILIKNEDDLNNEKEEKIFAELRALAVELNISIITTLQAPAGYKNIYNYLIESKSYFKNDSICIDNLITIRDYSYYESILEVYEYQENKNRINKEIRWAFPYDIEIGENNFF